MSTTSLLSEQHKQKNYGSLQLRPQQEEGLEDAERGGRLLRKGWRTVSAATVHLENAMGETELMQMQGAAPVVREDFKREFSLGGDDSMLLRKVYAARGNSIRQGPHRSLTWRWVVSVHGIEYMQLSLWLVKDWAWSQYWMYPAMICGVLALVTSVVLMIIAAREAVVSEAILSLGTMLWLLGNFVWMVGEFWEDDVIADPEEGEAFYNKMYVASRYIQLTASIWFFLYFWVFLPLNVFWEEQGSYLLTALNHNSPKPRFFKTFRDYESLHLFLWALKDLMWVWDLPAGYVILILPTMILHLDLLWLFASHLDQFIDFGHYGVLFFWLLANACWAFGELDREGASGDKVPDSDWDTYEWPSIPENRDLWPRYFAGWMFFFAGVSLVVFYWYWLCFPPFPNLNDGSKIAAMRKDSHTTNDELHTDHSEILDAIDLVEAI